MSKKPISRVLLVLFALALITGISVSQGAAQASSGSKSSDVNHGRKFRRPG